MSRNIDENKILMNIPLEYEYDFPKTIGLDPSPIEDYDYIPDPLNPMERVVDEYAPKTYPDGTPVSRTDLNSRLYLTNDELASIVDNNNRVQKQTEEVEPQLNKVEQSEPYQGLDSHLNMIGGRYGYVAAEQEAKKIQ